jgi:esterase/lipase
LSWYYTSIRSFFGQLQAKEKEVQAIIREKDAVVEAKNTVVEAKNKEVQAIMREMDIIVKAKDVVAKEKDERLKEKDDQITTLQHEAADKMTALPEVSGRPILVWEKMGEQHSFSILTFINRMLS